MAVFLRFTSYKGLTPCLIYAKVSKVTLLY
jgi:hypothetical protein